MISSEAGAAPRTLFREHRHCSATKNLTNGFFLKDRRSLADQVSFIPAFTWSTFVVAMRDGDGAHKNQIVIFVLSVPANDFPHEMLLYGLAVATVTLLSFCPHRNPQIEAAAKRRYWPAVRQWLDRHNGVLAGQWTFGAAGRTMATIVAGRPVFGPPFFLSGVSLDRAVLF
jgi:hypothetical protein